MFTFKRLHVALSFTDNIIKIIENRLKRNITKHILNAIFTRQNHKTTYYKMSFIQNNHFMHFSKKNTIEKTFF